MTQTLSPKEALNLAIIRAGNQKAFADILGVSQAAVSGWLRKSMQLPAEFVLITESTFAVSRHNLRPDIYPAEDQSARRFLARDQHATGIAA